MISLKPLDSQNNKIIHQIFPGQEGKYRVNFNWYWAELSRRRPNISADLIFVASQEEPIGFMAYGQHYHDRQLTDLVPGNFEIHHIVINAHFQGNGFGKAATIQAFKKMAFRSECYKLLVACHPDNKIATQLYRSLGFRAAGTNYDDDPLYSLDRDSVIQLKDSIVSLKAKNPMEEGAEYWENESIQSEKDFDWDAWEIGLET